MGRSQRDKGKRGEREWATMLRAATPGVDVRRGWQAAGGEDVADVEHPCFASEVKVGARPPMLRGLAQAEASAKPGQWPLCAARMDRKGWTVTMRAEDWLELVACWWRETR